MNVVETRGLAKAFRGKRAVDRFDMHVAQGDIYGFVGKNGAGKSTVMKMICGLVAPTEGEIALFGGTRPDGEDSLRIGALIEDPGLLPNLTAYENLMAKALASGIVNAPDRCVETLALVGLGEVGKKKVRGFSLGMKQRLGLALALIGSPDLLLLDEPLNGLDPEGTRAMRNLIVRLNQSLGVTVIISSHVLDQLDRMATRFGVIANGHMVREMTADEVQAECGDSLRVRTADPARTLALLEEALPDATFRAEPDGALVLVGTCDHGAVSRLLRDTDQTVLELSVLKRDIEDYFVELMEGGVHHV
ncbi:MULTISPECIES: ATP-binding cassette domain-containing protein [Gordonibacter]|uniref:ATP-binding cassette domain-containing protein n=1 Tax=Gordonibacter faecis TaxID=3047475 RepID=A0ABT7DKQ4_9ACTN|nr:MULTISPECIES: ATP-binding cassette domain-containing protein [unclassified Gordonibacter]MDJ1649832.1 ATP-binding cassette domain-containing protein [Gordonibacter sp. KGMB12511]HIW75496.1 ATP-binding cassette domain-containing protein [Candidatus Gordonibacter avicola]